MRIGIATVQVPFITGGAEIHVRLLKEQLEHRGHIVDIITLPFKWYPPQVLLDSIKAVEYLDLTEVNAQKEVKGIKEYAFFDCGIQGQGILEDKDNTKRYLSEDFYFCALWQQCGGEIWTDITSELKHIGIKTYERKPIAKRSYEKEKR